MPPPVVRSDPQSELELESDDVSDLESESSDESTDNDPLKTEEMSGLGHGTSTSHVLGKLPDNPKRKAHYEDDGEHPSKAQRLLTSVNSFSSPSTSSPNTSLTAMSTNRYIARQSFAAPFIEQATHLPCFELLKKTFPQYHPIKLRTFPFFLWLCEQPVRRIPPVSLKWNNKKTQNMPSFMMQACGDILPHHQACERCAELKGPYKECVVIKDPQVAERTRGSCANCWYGKLGSTCTLRAGVANTANVPPVSPPPPPTTTTAAGPPLHPSYAAALQGAPSSAASPVPTPALHPRFAAILERNNPSTQASVSSTSQQQPGPPQEKASLSPALSSLATSAAITTNLVQLWENRYRNMTPEKLIEAYEHLQEMQQDLNIRNQAIQRVILDGLRDALNAKKR